MREFAQVRSASSLACRLARNFPALGLDDLTLWPTDLCDQRTTLSLLEFCDFFFAGLRAAFEHCKNDFRIVPNGSPERTCKTPEGRSAQVFFIYLFFHIFFHLFIVSSFFIFYF